MDVLYETIRICQQYDVGRSERLMGASSLGVFIEPLLLLAGQYLRHTLRSYLQRFQGIG